MNGHDLDEFALDVRWAGPQDKPYYRATFVSETRRETRGDPPFHCVAVIGSDELNRLLAILLEHGVTLAPGGRQSDHASGYVVELSTHADEVVGSLGEERHAVPILTQLRGALTDEHRQPLDNVLNRLRGWTDA
jgi:hypothetical protein